MSIMCNFWSRLHDCLPVRDANAGQVELQGAEDLPVYSRHPRSRDGPGVNLIKLFSFVADDEA